MTARPSSVQILLLRNTDPNAATMDDKITVRWVNNEMSITYKDSVSDVIMVNTFSFISLRYYVNTLIRMVVADNEPFRAVQFNFPCFPTLLLSREDLKKAHVRKTLRSLAEITQDGWWNMGNKILPDSDSDSESESDAESESTEITVDEEEDGELEEEQPSSYDADEDDSSAEYEGMPPLEPIRRCGAGGGAGCPCAANGAAHMRFSSC